MLYYDKFVLISGMHESVTLITYDDCKNLSIYFLGKTTIISQQHQWDLDSEIQPISLKQLTSQSPADVLSTRCSKNFFKFLIGSAFCVVPKQKPNFIKFVVLESGQLKISTYQVLFRFCSQLIWNTNLRTPNSVLYSGWGVIACGFVVSSGMTVQSFALNWSYTQHVSCWTNLKPGHKMTSAWTLILLIYDM